MCFAITHYKPVGGVVVAVEVNNIGTVPAKGGEKLSCFFGVADLLDGFVGKEDLVGVGMDAQVGFKAQPALFAESKLQHKELRTLLLKSLVEFRENPGLVVRPEDIVNSQYFH